MYITEKVARYLTGEMTKKAGEVLGDKTIEHKAHIASKYAYIEGESVWHDKKYIFYTVAVYYKSATIDDEHTYFYWHIFNTFLPIDNYYEQIVTEKHKQAALKVLKEMSPNDFSFYYHAMRNVKTAVINSADYGMDPKLKNHIEFYTEDINADEMYTAEKAPSEQDVMIITEDDQINAVKSFVKMIDNCFYRLRCHHVDVNYHVKLIDGASVYASVINHEPLVFGLVQNAGTFLITVDSIKHNKKEQPVKFDFISTGETQINKDPKSINRLALVTAMIKGCTLRYYGLDYKIYPDGITVTGDFDDDAE